MQPSPKKLSLLDASLMVMGAILGVGIFFTPSQVASLVPSTAAYLTVWTIGCLVAVCGAFTFAEWSASFPKAGGAFVYLREVYGRPVSFLLAWVSLLVISTGAIPIMTGFGASMVGEVLSVEEGSSSWLQHFQVGAEGSLSHSLVSGGMIVGMTLIALCGAKASATFQNSCMLIKIGLSVTLIISGLLLFTPAPEQAEVIASAPLQGDRPIWQGMIMAMLPVLFACGGWPLIAYISTEIKDPVRNLPRALIWGVLSVVAIYLLLNWCYIRVIGIDYLATNQVFIGEVVERSLGTVGNKLISAALAVSAVGVCMVTILTTPWLYVAMAREKLFFKSFAQLHASTGAPVLGLMLQCLLALGYMMLGDSEYLVDSVVFVEWIFHVLIASGLIWIRAKRPDLERPFRSFGYPAMPLIYAIFAGFLVVGVVWQAEASQTLLGAGVIAVGIIAYPFWQRWLRARA